MEGRLNPDEERVCQSALVAGAETLAYVCSKIYLYLGGHKAAWEDTGLVGPLYIVKHCGVHYFALVELSSRSLKMVHEIHFPLEVRVMNSHFYRFVCSFIFF